MPMAKQQSDFAQWLVPVREAQAALVRAQGLGMGAAMEHVFAELVGKLEAEPVVARFQPLGGKGAQAQGRTPATPSGGTTAEQVATQGAPDQGVLARLTQNLMAQAIIESTRQRRDAAQAGAASTKPNARKGSALGALGILGGVDVGKAVSRAMAQSSSSTASRAGTAPGRSTVDAGDASRMESQAGAKALMPPLRRAVAQVAEQAARDATDPASLLPSDTQGAGMVPRAGAWRALSGIAALVKELAQTQAPAGKAAGARPAQASEPATASRATAGGSSTDRFPLQGFDVQAGRPAAGTEKASNPGLLGTGQASRGSSNFDCAPRTGGISGLQGSLEGLVSSVWAAMQEGVQQAGASKATRQGGLLVPRRISGAAGEQVASSGGSSTDTSARSVAPRSASMLAPAGQRSVASTAQQEATGGKVLAAECVAESVNDVLSPAAPGAVPTASGNLQPLSDEGLAEQLNRVLIEQAWRGGVDLS